MYHMHVHVCSHVVLYPLVDRLREYKAESSKVGAWLEEREAEFEACGTIGANLDRCIEQAVILEVSMYSGTFSVQTLLSPTYKEIVHFRSSTVHNLQYCNHL